MQRILKLQNFERAHRDRSKVTTLESADFTLQLLVLVTAEKPRAMYITFFLSIFGQVLFPLWQAELAQTMKAQI